MESAEPLGPWYSGAGPTLVALACAGLLVSGTPQSVLSSPGDSAAAVVLASAPNTKDGEDTEESQSKPSQSQPPTGQSQPSTDQSQPSTDQSQPSTSQSQPSTSQSRLFPPKMALGRVFILPLVSYAEERGFGVGGEFLFPFRLSGNNPESHPSEMRARAQVTFKGQTQIELSSTLYWRDGTHVMRVKVSHRDTAERFYGIGPDTPESNEEIYRPRRLQAYVEGFHNVLPYFRAGVRVEMEFFEFLERAPGGLLQAPVYSSTSSETVIGAGFGLEWDRRDQRYAPSRGYYYQVFGLLFDDALGSDFDFYNFNVDLRNYFTLSPQHVLATQVFLYGTTDSPPFWRNASLGGRAHSRGYRRDRYLDEVLFAVQAEYRAPVLWRLSLSGFAGTAAVAPEMLKLRYDTLRPTVGIGLNAHYKKNHAIVARFDAALGQEGVRLGLAINESF